MSILRDIESKLEGVFERGFRRAFRANLQPVELARKLAKEMEEHKTISVSRVYGPNEFTVYLSPADRESFSSYETALVTELAAYLEAHARGEGLSLVAPAAVLLETDEDLRQGEFGIACRMAESPAGPPVAPPSEEPAAEGGAEPPAAAAPAPPAPPPPERVYEPLAGVSGTQVISAEEARQAGVVPLTLTLVVAGRRHRVSKRVSTVGRSRDCDVIVPDPNVSRVHAEVRHSGTEYVLVDTGSTNGTEVNGRPATRHTLADGDVVVMGTTEIAVELR